MTLQRINYQKNTPEIIGVDLSMLKVGINDKDRSKSAPLIGFQIEDESVRLDINHMTKKFGMNYFANWV